MQTISTIGLDIAKSVFQVHGIDAYARALAGGLEQPFAGAPALRRKAPGNGGAVIVGWPN